MTDKEAPPLLLAVKTFVMRDPKRDLEIDRKRIAPILEAIEIAIDEISVERAGLVGRVRKTVDQPKNQSRKLLTQVGTPTTNPLTELGLAEKRLNLLARQIEQLRGARNLLRQS